MSTCGAKLPSSQYWGYIGVMEHKMETTILGYIGLYFWWSKPPVTGPKAATQRICAPSQTPVKHWQRPWRAWIVVGLRV